MAKLILKRFQCITDTTELGSESPYFLTFVGDIGTGRATLHRTHQGNWHNEVDKGETWPVNETVAEGFDLVPTKTIALSALVEQDEGIDISLAEINNFILFSLRAKLNDYRSAGVATVTPGVRSDMTTRFRSLLNTALASASGASDDLMGVKSIPLTGQAGELLKIPFSADGGLYHVRYAQG